MSRPGETLLGGLLVCPVRGLGGPGRMAIAGQWGWRAVFVALALFGAVLWLAVWRRLPATLLP